MTKLKTEPYKGVRDFYPEEMALEQYIFNTWRTACERFGYNEYSASILEPSELYEAKTGDEIVSEQTYSFEDRAGRRVTLRPEMTPSVARMVAARRRELSFPLRLYSMQNMFRYERPQKGRLREHWQLNADLFGESGSNADLEILSLARDIMLKFGASDDQFVIKVSDRSVLDDFLSREGINESQKKNVIKVLDKKGKIENFDAELESAAGKVLEFDSIDTGLVIDTALLDFKVEVDMSIVRGFEYYTGMTFEVFDTSDENSRSLFGGGRYDSLLEIFGSDPMPAVGFGMGDVTIADFLATHNLLPAYKNPVALFIMSTSNKEFDHAKALASKLREQGVNITLENGENIKLDRALKHTDKSKIPYFCLVGPDEIRESRYRIRDVKAGKESAVLMSSEIANHILARG